MLDIVYADFESKSTYGRLIVTDKPISDELFYSKKESLKKAIEFILNDNGYASDSSILEKFKQRFGIGGRLRTYKINFEEIDEFFNSNKIFIEEDMRKCFEESRKTNPIVGFKHDSFQDYLESLNK